MQDYCQIHFLEGNLHGKTKIQKKKLGFFKAMERNGSSKTEMKWRT